MYPNGSVFHMNLIDLDVAKDASHIQAYSNMKKTMKVVLKWYIFWFEIVYIFVRENRPLFQYIIIFDVDILKGKGGVVIG